MLVCDKCGASINAGSMFCAQCGDPVTEADKITKAVSASDVATVQITFGNSTSAGYAKAVSICEKLPSYQVVGEGKQIQHKVMLPITEVDLVANIFDLVGSWKSSQMLINGQPATKKNLTYYGVGCYRNRQKAYKPEAYCYGERQHEANIWGCTRLGMPIYEWGGGWLDYGQFDANGVWRFDKMRIRHELEVALKENELCPVLNRARVLETLDRLPETIDPRSDKNWQYRTSYEDVNGSYKEVAVGIRPILNKINRYIVGGFRPQWEEEPQTKNVRSSTLGDVATANIQHRRSNEMAMITCQECNNEMSDAASSCPKCGKPNPSAPQNKKSIGFLLGAGILFIPLIFSWFTLRKGHSILARVVAFSWLALVLVIGGSKNDSTQKTTEAIAQKEIQQSPAQTEQIKTIDIRAESAKQEKEQPSGYSLSSRQVNVALTLIQDDLKIFATGGGGH